jgi:uncharacterized protein with PQ loop repeat
MSQGFHHVRIKKHTKPHGKFGKTFDKSMYVIALIGPVMTLPQAYDVWSYHQKASVSLATWAAYTLVSFLWLAYGVVHKEKILIFVNFLMVILDGAIVTGLLLH